MTKTPSFDDLIPRTKPRLLKAARNMVRDLRQEAGFLAAVAQMTLDLALAKAAEAKGIEAALSRVGRRPRPRRAR